MSNQENKTVTCNWCEKKEVIPPDGAGFELSGKFIEDEYYCGDCPINDIERHGLLTVRAMTGEFA